MNSLNVRHLSRPGMDEGSKEEERIEQMTGELMKQVGECNRQLAAVQRHSGLCGEDSSGWSGTL